MARTRTRTDNNNEEKKAVVSDRRRRTRSDNADSVEESNVSTRKDQPTPSARQRRSAGSTGLISRIPIVRGVVGYFRGVASEMQKVTWPSREEATRLTSVVLGVTIAFAIVLGLLDTFFGWWFQQAFSPDSEPLFLGIAALVFLVVSGSFFALRNRI